CKAVKIEQGDLISRIIINGKWELPYSLDDRKIKKLSGEVDYELRLELNSLNNRIDVVLKLDNDALDHRLRMILQTDVGSKVSTSDTAFGMIDRPIEEEHLNDWKEGGFKEDPTSMRPMIH
ncbi:glycoside hydrolase family 38 C-terminal domain-containing protein, partial [Bacillus cereus]|uniref:glycoside hydrolase family 38 C-terminal domain-containing protein n=1 Tax=Bacillus cereus TaxID=1396 RepID=UPI000C01D400